MPKKNTYKTKSVAEVKKGFTRGNYYLTPEWMKLLTRQYAAQGLDRRR